MSREYRIRSAFNSAQDEFARLGKRPVVFDVLGPDRTTSLLPDDLKMVLHVNPTSLQWSYQRTVTRTQTLGGWVEFHWGVNPTEVSFEALTGGFVRLYSGLSNITGPTPSNDLLPAEMRAVSVGGTRRETIAYDKFLDLLALFKYNGALYDTAGNIALQGMVSMAYDGGTWNGWFTTFRVEETAERPYQFSLSASFQVLSERHRLRTVAAAEAPIPRSAAGGPSDGAVAESPPPPPPPPDEAAWQAATDQEFFGAPLESIVGPPPRTVPRSPSSSAPSRPRGR